MTAAEITEKAFPMQYTMPVLAKVQRVTASDWVVFSDYKGVIPLGAMGQSIAVSLAETVPTWGVATVTTTATATTTSIAVTGATITRSATFYVITAGGEIMEVTADSDTASATPTWTVRRGALGTTATATGLAATNVVGIMNILFMPANNVGPNMMVVFPLPQDARTKPFA